MQAASQPCRFQDSFVKFFKHVAGAATPGLACVRATTSAGKRRSIGLRLGGLRVEDELPGHDRQVGGFRAFESPARIT